MEGETGPHLRRLEKEMRAAAAAMDYERAARLRDDIGALRKVVEKNAVVLPDGTDADVFALAADELEASIQVFHVRGGRIRGQRGWVVERVEELDDAGLVEHLLQQVYGDAQRGTRRAQGRALGGQGPRAGRATGRPPAWTTGRTPPPPRCRARSSCRCCPPTPPGLEDWLSGLRGARVRIRVPQRGDKKALAETVHTNAEQALALHKARRAGDLTSRSKSLTELQEALELAEPPLRIECYDISHTQGTHQVGSMVVFEDGLPEEVRVPPLHRARRERRGRPGRHRRHGRGAPPPVQALRRRARGSRGRPRRGRPQRRPGRRRARG